MKRFISVFMALVMCFSVLCVPSFAAEYSIKATRSYGNGYTYLTLKCAGTDIYYTTDGTLPTTESKLYTSKVKLTKPTTVRVAAYVGSKAVKRLRLNVAVKVKKPTVTENGTNSYKVTAPAGSKVYYTTNGATPTAKSALCNGTVTAKAGTVLKFVAVKQGYKNSSVVTVNVPKENPVEDYATQVLNLVNKERAAYGLSALTTDPTLTKAAQVRAEELKTSFAHSRPDGSSCFTVLDEYNVFYWSAGENIAAGYPTPEAVVEGWMNSTGHRANILSANFTAIGIGYATSDAGYGTYWSQVFIGV